MFTILEKSFPVGLVAGLVSAAVLIGVGVFFLFLFLHRKGYQSVPVNLKKKLENIETTLDTDCKTSLTRLQTLSKNSKKFEDFYALRNDQYTNLVNKYNTIDKQIENLASLINDKDFKQAKEIEREIAEDINKFDKDVSIFSGDLSSILQDDTDTASAAVTVKNNLRSIRNFYEKNTNELSELGQSFQLILNDAENTLDQFNELCDSAKFEEAKTLLDDLNRLLTATISVMDCLPMLQASVYTVLPNKLDELEKNYHEMLDEKYVIEDLDVDNYVDQARKQLELIKSNLVFLDITGVQEKIDKIQTDITDFNAKFNEEKNAKQCYFNSTNDIIDTTYNIEREYSSHMNMIDKYKVAYMLDQKYVDQMYSLKSHIETIGMLKRELDSYLDTTNHQPYTTIMKKMNALRTEMSRAKRTMHDYQAYLDDLKNTTQNVYDGLNNLFVSLRVERAHILSLGVDSYTTAIKPKFDYFFKKIADLSSQLVVLPLDVKKISRDFYSLKDDCGYFLSDTHNNYNEALKAEQAIVRSNLYREDYTECKLALEKAEQAYNSGNFKDATALASEALSTFSKGSLPISNS